MLMNCCMLQGGREEINRKLEGYGFAKFFKDNGNWENQTLLRELSSFEDNLHSYFHMSQHQFNDILAIIKKDIRKDKI